MLKDFFDFLLAQVKDRVSTVIHVQASSIMSIFASKSRNRSFVGVIAGSMDLTMSTSQSIACLLEGHMKE